MLSLGPVALVAGFDGRAWPYTSAGLGDPIDLEGRVLSGAYDESTRTLVAGVSGGRVARVDLDEPAGVTTLVEFTDQRDVTAVATSRGAERVVIGRQDGSIYLIAGAGGAPVAVANVGEVVLAAWIDERAEAFVVASSTRWYRFRFDGQRASTTRLRSGGALDIVSVSGEEVHLGMSPGVVESRSVSDGDVRSTAKVGAHALIPAITTAGKDLVVSVVEVPGADLNSLKALQYAAAVDTPTGVNADFLEPLQQSSVVRVNASGGILWRKAVANPVVALAAIDPSQLAVLDTHGDVVLLDLSDGSELERYAKVVPRGGYMLQRVGSRLYVVGAGNATRTAEIDAGRLRLAPVTRNGWVYGPWGTDVLFKDVGATGRAAADTLSFIGEPVRTGGREVAAVAVPGMELLAVASSDTQIDFWRAGQLVATVPYGAGRLQHLFAAGPSALVMMDDRGNVERLDLDGASLRRRACALAGRNLTAAEWSTYFPDEPSRETCR